MRISVLVLFPCLGVIGCVDSVVDRLDVVDSPGASASRDEVTDAIVGDPTFNDSHNTKVDPVTSQSIQPQYNELNNFEKKVLLDKGTERAFTGEYTDLDDKGTYVCRRCDAALYRSEHKFHSHCGWPAFDDEIDGAVTHLPDADGRRTEIICTNCGGHLGHVFVGEQMTDKNVRHCVNSVSMKFIAADKTLPKAISPNVTE